MRNQILDYHRNHHSWRGEREKQSLVTVTPQRWKIIDLSIRLKIECKRIDSLKNQSHFNVSQFKSSNYSSFRTSETKIQHGNDSLIQEITNLRLQIHNKARTFKMGFEILTSEV